MRSIQFRADINTLRALAVTTVVLFHYKISIFRGGFVGVDVFFVISGYLMTAIITHRLDKGSFSLIGFYGDRARRIVPPLAGLVLSLSILGYFLIDPYNYQKLAASGISALLFFSNFRFWMEAGYFDAGNYTKWFLHTWSLSVEWQFYLIYPLIVLGLVRFVKVRRRLLLMLWLIALISLAACVWFSSKEPASAFYLLPFRGWELLAGGIVALQFDQRAPRDKRLAYALVTAGLGLIFFAVFTFNENTPWPSYWALFPVAGTCLVIAARQTTLPLFTNSISRILGEWSYSIYLWHWPVAVGAYYLGYAQTTPVKVACELVFLIAFMGIGGTLLTSFKTAWKAKGAARVAPGWALPLAAIFMAALLLDVCIDRANGLTGRRADGAQLVEAYSLAKSDFNYPASCDGLDDSGALKPCHVGQAEHGKSVLFIGDSQAMQIYARFTEALAHKYNTSFTFLAAHGCPPILGVGETGAGSHCAEFMEKAFKAAGSGAYSRVILVSRWIYIRHLPNLDEVFAAFSERLKQLTQHGVKVVIVSATPVPAIDPPQEVLRRRFFGYSTDSVAYEDRTAIEKDLINVKPRLKTLAESSGAVFVDPLDYLCAEHRCAMVDENGDTLFWDQSHFRGRTVKSERFKFLDEAAGLQETAQVK